MVIDRHCLGLRFGPVTGPWHQHHPLAPASPSGIDRHYCSIDRHWHLSKPFGSCLGFRFGRLYYAVNLNQIYFGRLTSITPQNRPRNYEEAYKWFRHAADQGHGYAQVNLGFFYRDGEGVQQDYVQAYMWLSLASSSPQKPIGFLSELRDSVAKKMTAAQIA